MKKYLFILASAAILFSGCAKLDDAVSRIDKAEIQISALQKDLEAVKASVSSLSSQVNAGKSIASVSETAAGWDVKMSDGQTISIKNGADGDSFFQSVTIGDDSVTFVFTDGTTAVVPFYAVLSQIASLQFIPEYSDGCATIDLNGPSVPTVEMSFLISPAAAAAALAEHIDDYDYLLTANAVETRSIALEAVPAGAAIDGNVLTISADASSFLSGVAVSLVINRSDFEEIASAFVPVAPAVLKYAGESYKVCGLKDGRVWMAENLRYLPEGIEPKSDFTDNTGIWYPAALTWDAAAGATIEPSKAVVAAQGYLYTEEVALGGKLPTTDYADAESRQGICPEGWAIPTAEEWITLVGACSNKDHTNTGAAYFDEALAGAPLAALNADGFNLLPFPYVNQGKSYLGSVLNKDASRPFYGMSSMTYFASATGRSNTQSYAAMITNNATKSSVNVAYNTLTNGVAVRCIKTMNVGSTPPPPPFE